MIGALTSFGNVKFAFKTLSSKDISKLKGYLLRIKPERKSLYKKRHEPIFRLQEILGEDAYYLGHIIEDELEEKLKENPNDEEAKKEEARRLEIVELGKINYAAYLASDHMDVYIATSMRERHEYVLVNETSKKIFKHPLLDGLKLRWFDPTQAYCRERTDKGLSEALMLKRAKCTVYFVQEIDTFGKDSELASTLAQGKPVIAFIPTVNDEYFKTYLDRITSIYPNKDEAETLLEQLRLINPSAAWEEAEESSELRSWIEGKNSVDISKAKDLLFTKMKEKFDKRAKLLQEDHPLGIQVALESGVANGVLVVRTVDQCAAIIYRVLTRTLEFDVKYEIIDGSSYIFLIEKVSNSIFRVITGNQLLTNAFWNFYLD